VVRGGSVGMVVVSGFYHDGESVSRRVRGGFVSNQFEWKIADKIKLYQIEDVMSQGKREFVLAVSFSISRMETLTGGNFSQTLRTQMDEAVKRLPTVQAMQADHHQALSKARMGRCVCHPRFKVKRWASMRG
jgi:hypothetical protein